MSGVEVCGTYEFIVELHKFYNVDLFLRGMYQIEASLRVLSARLPTRVKVSVSPSQTQTSSTNGTTHLTSSATNQVLKTSSRNNSSGIKKKYSSNNMNSSNSSFALRGDEAQHSSKTDQSAEQNNNTSAKTRKFNILFRNEEIDLNQVVLFRVTFNTDLKSLDELNYIEFKLELKLIYNNVQCSQRELILNLLQNTNINYYRPIFFDYFHLCAVGISVHGGLITLHLTKGLTSDLLLRNKSASTHGQPHDSNSSIPSSSCVSAGSGSSFGQKSALTNAIHKGTIHLLQILQVSNRNLQSKLHELEINCLNKKKCNTSKSNYVEDGLTNSASGGISANKISSSCGSGPPPPYSSCVPTFSTKAKYIEDIDDELDEILIISCKKMSQYCAENIILWHRFLDTIIGQESVRKYLAIIHHEERIKRFTEGFYVTRNQLSAIFTPKDYTGVVELLKTTIINSMNIKLQIECVELDGNETSIPIIFEDQYKPASEINGANLKASQCCYCTQAESNQKKPLKKAPPLPKGIENSEKNHVSLVERRDSTSFAKNGKLTLFMDKDTLSVAVYSEESSVVLDNEVDGILEGTCGKVKEGQSTTLPRRHSSSAAVIAKEAINSKAASATNHAAIRKYASTPLLNSDDVELEGNEECSWFLNDNDNSSPSTSSLDDNLFKMKLPPKTRSISEMRFFGHQEEASARVIASSIPPPAEFQDPPEMFRDPPQLPLPPLPDPPSLAFREPTSTQKHNPLRAQESDSTSYGYKDLKVTKFNSLQYHKKDKPLSLERDNSAKQEKSSNQRTNERCVGDSVTADGEIFNCDIKLNFHNNNRKTQRPLPYFQIPDELRIFHPNGLHLIICVHGLDGSSHDLRLFKIYLEINLPGQNLHFLMSEKNQDGHTFSDFEAMTMELLKEILNYIECFKLAPKRISFIGHSLGNIIIRNVITKPEFQHLLPCLHTFLSLSGPHLGTVYNQAGLINFGMWVMQKWKKSNSLLQLCMKDSSDYRQTFMYKLCANSKLDKFKYILLTGSSQDRYVPLHSAHMLNCKASLRDSSQLGEAYRSMISSLLNPVLKSNQCQLVRYDIHHALTSHSANSIIGRAAHIAVLDSEIFIEKFLSVSAIKYFT